MSGSFVKFFTTLCIWIAVAANAEPLEGTKVKYVKMYDMNFVVALARIDRSKPRVTNVFCSGALITSTLILTNEHCFKRKIPENVVAYVGSYNLNDGVEYSVCKWISYRDWRNNEMPNEPSDQGTHDLGIAKLCNSVDQIVTRPALLSGATYERVEKSSLKMIGWGTVEKGFASEYMREAKVKIYDQEKCYLTTKLRSIARQKIFCTSANPQVLAGDGDSGGPLLDGRNNIVGVTSATWVIPRNTENSVNIHINVTYYKDFITRIMEEY